MAQMLLHVSQLHMQNLSYNQRQPVGLQGHSLAG
jgi:hypothetical protein